MNASRNVWCVVSVLSISQAGGLILRPIDDGPRDSAFAATRAAVVAALQTKDDERVRALVAGDVKVSPTGEGGLDAFIQVLSDSDGAPRDELIKILRMGGTFEGKPGSRMRFCAPYVYSTYPELSSIPDKLIGEVKPLVIVGKGVSLRRLPNPAAPIVATLSYTLVRYLGDVTPHVGLKPLWIHVETADGHQGYVARVYARSPDDFHVCFEKRGEQWLLTEFYEQGL